MERRDFLKLASMAGIAVVAGGSTSSQARGDAKYKGPLWIMIHAGGGWDVTSVCDPKGTFAGDTDPVNKFPKSAIPMAGNISYAPMELSPDVMKSNMTYTAGKTFFEKNFEALTVINGIDHATNSHDAGTRIAWAGTLIEGKPTVAAIIAASYLPTAPMGFVTFGGYDTTDGIVGAARLGNIQALQRIAYPHELNPGETDPTKIQYYNSDATVARMAAAQQARYNAMLKAQRLPRVQESMSQLFTSRIGSNELSELTQFLPKSSDLKGGMVSQAQLAIAAYKAGLCVSANLSEGHGWDTHGNNDQNVANNMQGNGNNMGLFAQLQGIMDVAEQANVADNMVVMIGSDFGRTPHYNDGNGKDHWSIASMMMFGSINGKKIKGNRVLGQTTDRHDPMNIDVKTMKPSDTGVRLTPAHINWAVRNAAGVQDSAVSKLYPTGVSDIMPLFDLES